MLDIFPKLYGPTFYLLPALIKKLPKDIIIVTGRSVNEKYYTLEWLKKWGILSEVWFAPNTRPCTDITSSTHKINTIKRLKLKKFYESSVSQAKLIEKEVDKYCEVKVWEPSILNELIKECV